MKTFWMGPKLLAGGMACLIVLLATLTYFSDPYGFYSVCKQCGMIRLSTKWMLPGTFITVFTNSKERSTPLSRTVLNYGIVPPHKHDWLFGQGSGHGVTCAIGSGRHIWPAAQSQKLADLLLLLHKHGKTEFRDQILVGVLDPETTQLFMSLTFDAPGEPVTALGLEHWIATESKALEEKMEFWKRK
ncbi:MAG: hypothetical protein AB1813_08770 [Verrucomicrobiota bacterium]